MTRHPSNPDDMSLSQISAYIQSPLYPDKDKTRTPQNRIKEHIKRWHPERFRTKLLPKVVEDEREKVKHGAGNVARYLSDLLRMRIIIITYSATNGRVSIHLSKSTPCTH